MPHRIFRENSCIHSLPHAADPKKPEQKTARPFIPACQEQYNQKNQSCVLLYAPGYFAGTHAGTLVFFCISQLAIQLARTP
jgi:hypothetical protein